MGNRMFACISFGENLHLHSFAGIAPGGVIAFVVAQLLGAMAALLVGRLLYR